jgi:hypothetical protein
MEYFRNKTEISTRENGLMIKFMGMASTQQNKEIYMKDNGKMTKDTDKVNLYFNLFKGYYRWASKEAYDG